MKLQKDDLRLLLIYALIGAMAACVTGYFLYQNKQAYWKTQAHDAFRLALMEEVQKRSEENVYFSLNGDEDLSVVGINDRKKRPITVPMMSKYGKKDFIVPYEKHIHNIERSSDWRAIRSIVLGKYPLKADSLYLVWNGLLAKTGYSGRTIVRLSVTDWWENKIDTYAGDSLYLSKSDSLVTFYLGYRCEVGVTGYFYYPWWQIYSLMDKALLSALFVGCLLLFFILEHVVRMYRRFFVKEVPVVVEKEVLVIGADRIQSHIYQLETDLFFDADSGELKKADACIKLRPMSAKLLQGFLDAKDYRLTNDEIMKLLWPDGRGTSGNVHSNIGRLRRYLSEISGWTIENRNFTYQLKKLHSIEKNLE